MDILSRIRTMFFKSQREIEDLNVKECLAMLRADPSIALVDVRRAEEYQKGAIPGSIHLELAEMLDGKWERLLPYKDTGVILQCHSGVCSLKAAQYLASQGFTKLWNMQGGIVAYRKAHLEGPN